jgi:hypothetical protein
VRSDNFLNSDGAVRLPNPVEAARAWFTTPQARDWKDGKSPKSHGRHSDSVGVQVSKAGHKGYLNPQFVELLMGYQTDWTELSALATRWFRPKRGKRSDNSCSEVQSD